MNCLGHLYIVITSMSSYNHSHQEYIVNGEDYMRMQFYVSGSKQQATAHLDLKKVLTHYPYIVITCNYNYVEFQWEI